MLSPNDLRLLSPEQILSVQSNARQERANEMAQRKMLLEGLAAKYKPVGVPSGNDLGSGVGALLGAIGNRIRQSQYQKQYQQLMAQPYQSNEQDQLKNLIEAQRIKKQLGAIGAARLNPYFAQQMGLENQGQQVMTGVDMMQALEALSGAVGEANLQKTFLDPTAAMNTNAATQEQMYTVLKNPGVQAILARINTGTATASDYTMLGAVLKPLGIDPTTMASQGVAANVATQTQQDQVYQTGEAKSRELDDTHNTSVANKDYTDAKTQYTQSLNTGQVLDNIYDKYTMKDRVRQAGSQATGSDLGVQEKQVKLDNAIALKKLNANAAQDSEGILRDPVKRRAYESQAAALTGGIIDYESMYKAAGTEAYKRAAKQLGSEGHAIDRQGRIMKYDTNKGLFFSDDGQYAQRLGDKTIFGKLDESGKFIPSTENGSFRVQEGGRQVLVNTLSLPVEVGAEYLQSHRDIITGKGTAGDLGNMFGGGITRRMFGGLGDAVQQGFQNLGQFGQDILNQGFQQGAPEYNLDQGY